MRAHSLFCKTFFGKMGSQNIPELVVPFQKWNIHYVKVGHGPHVVFAMPGILGTIWSTFEELIADIDRDKFTLIVWDPPGFGNSRPPDIEFKGKNDSLDYAEQGIQFMEQLGYTHYSILGWCGGGRAGIIIAARYPERVRSLVIWSLSSYMNPADRDRYNKIKDLDRWSHRMRDPLVALYGEELLQRYWHQWIESLEKIIDEGGDICNDYLDKVQCPTYLMFGKVDPVINTEEHAPYLHERIKGSKLYIDPSTHDFHKTSRVEFNKRVQEFLLEN